MSIVLVVNGRSSITKCLKKMKILSIIGGYIPAKKYGGPVVSINNLANLLYGQEHQFYIVTVDHDLKSNTRFDNITEGWNTLKNCKVLYLREEEISYRRLKKILFEIKPEVVYLNSLFLAKFTVPFILLALIMRQPTLLAPRGDICVNVTGKYKKIPYIYILRPMLRSRYIYYQSTSDEETRQIKKYISPLRGHLFCVSNVSDCSIVDVKKGEKLSGKLRCIFVSRIQRKKNLVGALRVLAKCSEKIDFDIFGPKEDQEYWKECESIIAYLPKNIRVYYKGVVEHDLVRETIGKYDLFFFPTFTENYGHVIVEALQASTPVLISDQTPWIDLQAYDAGWAFPLTNIQGFVNTLNKLALCDNEEFKYFSCAAKRYIEEKTDIISLKNQYIDMFETVSMNEEGKIV